MFVFARPIFASGYYPLAGEVVDAVAAERQAVVKTLYVMANRHFLHTLETTDVARCGNLWNEQWSDKPAWQGMAALSDADLVERLGNYF